MKLKDLADKGVIDFPNITEAEIEDRSKGDILSKGLVVIQTTWFIMQCGARGIEGLSLTELEIVTLAYAAVNFATYSIWLYKPLNVQSPYRVQQKPVPNSNKQDKGVQAGVTGIDYAEPKQEGGSNLTAEGGGNVDVLGQPPNFIKRYFDGEHGSTLFFEFLLLPVAPFIAMALGSNIEFRHPLRVHTFSSGTEKNVPIMMCFAAAAVATAFGAIHCIAWSFDFPSRHELLLWRISSLVITATPLYMFIVAVLLDRKGALTARINIAPGGFFHNLFTIIKAAFALFLGGWVLASPVAGFLYILARLDVLVQAFVALRALPEGAFETVEWTAFIPHI